VTVANGEMGEREEVRRVAEREREREKACTERERERMCVFFIIKQ
jgi:hypothetical protein